MKRKKPSATGREAAKRKKEKRKQKPPQEGPGLVHRTHCCCSSKIPIVEIGRHCGWRCHAWFYGGEK
jgi:hypothetical protein